MGNLGYVTEKGLRDFAYRVLKGEVGSHMQNGVYVLGKYTDEQLKAFADQMPEWQLKQMYQMIYGSEMNIDNAE